MSYCGIEKRRWSLDKALHFVRELEDHLGGRYHVALGGGVLMKGYSDKDVDIWVYPHSLSDYSLSEMKELLYSFGMSIKVDKETVHTYWKKAGSTDFKHVEIWIYKGKRVDLILPYGG